MIQNSLDFPSDEWEKILEQTSELILHHYQRLSSMKGFNVESQPEVASWFEEPLPLSPTSFSSLLPQLKTQILDSATGNLGENMYAYVMSGGNQVSTLAEFMMSTVNQNNAKWHLAPAMAEIEKRVVHWADEMIGIDTQAGGAMVSGGSEANLAGLTVARNIFFRQYDIKKKGLFGVKPFLVYCSSETHNCIDKSIALLGIGTDNIRKIPVNECFQIDTKALLTQIEADTKDGFLPFCLIGNAGTVNTGAIDDLETLASIAKAHQMWFHIDGAYGGLASTLPELKQAYRGIHQADSIALDFHKWLYQPFEIGCVLVKNWDILRETYFKQADYLHNSGDGKIEFNEHYFQLSRNAKAFKVWLSVKVYGFEKIQQMIRKDILLANYLAEQIKQTSNFELMSQDKLAVICFRYIKEGLSEDELSEFNLKLTDALEKDGRIFIAGTKLNGKFVLRACLINHRKQTSSIDYLMEVIDEVASGL